MITVRFKDMPTTIKSFVTNGEDADTIVINSRLSHEQQKCCYLHEVQHLMNRDFEKFNCDAIEKESHEKKKEIS